MYSWLQALGPNCGWRNVRRSCFWLYSISTGVFTTRTVVARPVWDLPVDSARSCFSCAVSTCPLFFELLLFVGQILSIGFALLRRSFITYPIFNRESLFEAFRHIDLAQATWKWYNKRKEHIPDFFSNKVHASDFKCFSLCLICICHSCLEKTSGLNKISRANLLDNQAQAFTDIRSFTA